MRRGGEEARRRGEEARRRRGVSAGVSARREKAEADGEEAGGQCPVRQAGGR